MDKGGKISVCMATYNGEKYIIEQLDSICKQLNAEDEVIISDDGSSDHTVDIIKKYNDAHIKLVFNEGNHGYTPNFYNALKYATGDIIFLSDQDDIWTQDKIEVMRKALINSDFVHSDSKIINQDKKILSESRNSLYGVRKGFLPNLLKSRYIGCNMAFKRIVKEAIFPVPIYSNSYPHDLWIALIAEKYFRTEVISDCLVRYRRHGDNASDGGGGKKTTILDFCKKVGIRFYYFYYVFRQCRHVKKIKKEFGYR